MNERLEDEDSNDRFVISDLRNNGFEVMMWK